MERMGQFAISKAGHDKGSWYVIIAAEGDFVYLSDGNLRPPEKPKKKRRKHVQPVNCFVGEELLHKLESGAKVYAEEIKYALKQYKCQ